MHLDMSEFWSWLPIAGELHVACALLVCFHCLRYRREANSALLWIFAAWSFPFVGALFYLSFGVDRVTLKAGRRSRVHEAFLTARRERETESLPMAYWHAVHEAVAAEPASPFAADLNRSMETILPDFPLLSGNRVELLVAGDEAYPAMLEAIRSARHHIHVQTFIVSRDATGREFLDALRAKADEGVNVRFLFDRFGSTAAFLSGMLRRYDGVSPRLQVAGWTQANPLKRQFQINLRNHRKALIVDGRVAFTGGLNFSDINRAAPGRPADRDYHFRIRGPIVQELQFSFLSDWHFMTAEDTEHLLLAEHFPHLASEGEALVRLVNSGPTAELETLVDVFFNCLVAARRQILAVTPYFVPTPDILRAFRSAALRGVEVKLVLPEKNNHFYAGLAGCAFYGDLLDAGVRIFERRPPFMHAKALIVDDAVALICTANLDARSLRLNYENDLVVYDPEFINQLKRAVLDDLAASREIEPGRWHARPVYRRLAENFCALLSPVL